MAVTIKDLTVSEVADVTAWASDGELVAFNVGPDGACYFVWALRTLDYLKSLPGGASTAKTQPDTPQSYRIVGLRGPDVVCDVLIEREPFNVHHVQPLPGALLIACARCRRRSERDIERNGRIYSVEGQLLDSIVLGDGIQDIQCTPSGLIWTSYFDEGVFGNYGWDAPLGAPGLVAWDRSGNMRHAFEPPAGLDAICDCYALNVASERDVWCSYYTEFPIVHLRDGRTVRSWPSPISGSSAFAIGHSHVLMRGGYKRKDEYTLCTLPSSGAPRVEGAIRLIDDFGTPLDCARVAGRGSALHLLAGNKLYQVDIATALGALG
jgi:hypothetical protein